MNWKQNINLKKHETLGLDIGSSAIKMVALRKSGRGYSAVAAGITEIAPSGVDGDRQRANTVKAIRECFARTKVKRKLAVCGVNGPEVAVRDFELPLLSAEEIAGAVSLEASQVCPFPAEDSAIDYQLIPNGSDHTRGILVAAMNTLVATKKQLAKDARLRCVLMDVDGLALLNCFKGVANGDEKTETGRTVAILNVGGSHTTLAIMDTDGRPFVRDMTHAGDEIVRQITAETGEPTEAIKEILSGDSTAIDQVFQKSLERACQKLIADVNETLRYYTTQGKSASTDRLLVCGGFALAGGFIELLNSRLGAECVLWNPFDQMHCDTNRNYQDVFARTGPALAVAAGLAMRSIQLDS
ncbi:MAG: type IV pilus assembly protein PilM [Planctomycetota bacterium]|nr:type IV pilus assembly protein PilM [Planctomycetota bacterium]